ncbi:MAG: MBL fold metallo-hydrolase [Ardenticatenales bacterium]|nr:MBL fold metallo-hydrolase [Ardenticatenales bacterium]
MLIKYFYDEALAQASYLVACQARGVACVVDPMRDIAPYLDAAVRQGLKVTHVTETHIHADFVSGARELAAATGAQLLLSDEGAPDWRYRFAEAAGATLLHDGDVFTLGRIRFEVLATPGHTPEHIVFIVTDTAAADEPIGIFTGDCVFVGDVGRPDLLETAAGVAGSKEVGARQQFASIARLSRLPDYLQLWPGHGAGSACGKALGAIPSTTLGYERRFNPAFQTADEGAFVRWLLDGQPEPPRYFGRMKAVNRDGPALIADLPSPTRLDRGAIEALLADGAQVLDLRPQSEHARHHIPGALSIPATRANFTTYVGWVTDYGRPVHLIVADPQALPAHLTALRAIGVDDVRGFAGPDVLQDDDPALPTIDVAELAAMLRSGAAHIVDVRGLSEWKAGHLPGAVHIPLGEVADRLGEIPRSGRTILQCQTGYRAYIAATVLRRAGVMNVVPVVDPRSEFLALVEPVRAVQMADEGR